MTTNNGYANMNLRTNKKPALVPVDPVVPENAEEFKRLSYRQRVWLKVNHPQKYSKFAGLNH